MTWKSVPLLAILLLSEPVTPVITYGPENLPPTLGHVRFWFETETVPTESQDIQLNDRFFPEIVYRHLEEFDAVETRFLLFQSDWLDREAGYVTRLRQIPGTEFVSAEDVAQLAAEIFAWSAAAVGLTENGDIETAMLCGEFNPDPKDLVLARQGGAGVPPTDWISSVDYRVKRESIYLPSLRAELYARLSDRWVGPTTVRVAVPCERAVFEIVNAVPVRTEVAAAYPVNDYEVEVERYTLEPGETLRRSHFFVGVEPHYSAFGRTADPVQVSQIMRLLGENDHTGVIYFEGGDDDPATPYPLRSAERYRLVMGEDSIGPNSDYGFFVHYPVDSLTSVAKAIFQNPEVCRQIMPQLRDGDTSAVEDWAQAVRRSLDRQLSVSQGWSDPDSDFPYRLGLVLHDDNGPFAIGVRVDGVVPTTVFGEDMQFVAGDRIHLMNGINVFVPEDILYALNAHATDRDRGIKKPLDFEVRRGSRAVTLQSTFFFNEDYWLPRTKVTELEAGLRGFANGVLLGRDGAAENAKEMGKTALRFFKGLKWKDGSVKMRPGWNEGALTKADLKKKSWQFEQDSALARQLFPQDFKIGSLSAFAVPVGGLLRAPIARSLTRAGIARGGAAVVLSAAALETAEGALWMWNDAPLRTEEQMKADMKELVFLSGGMGIVTGAASRRMGGLK